MALNSRLGTKKTSLDANLVRPGQTRSNTTLTSTTGSATNRSAAMAAQRRTASTLNSATSGRNIAPPSATLARSNRKLLEKTGSVASRTSTNGRALKLRPANAPIPPPLPVLCIYSDQNELIRKEQFRVPASTILSSRIPSMIDPQQFAQNRTAQLKIRNNENLNNISLKNGTGAVKRPALSSNKTIDSNSNQRLKPTAATRASQPASRIEIPSTNQRLKLNRNSSTAASSTATNRSTVIKTTAKPTATLAPGTQLTAAPIDGVGGYAGAFHSNWNFFQPEAMSRWNFFFVASSSFSITIFFFFFFFFFLLERPYPTAASNLEIRSSP